MSVRLLLDEHCAGDISDRLNALGHDMISVVAEPELRSGADDELIRWAVDKRR